MHQPPATRIADRDNAKAENKQQWKPYDFPSPDEFVVVVATAATSLVTTAATSLVLLPQHWSLYWTIAANGFQLFFLAVSLDATVYFGAHGTNFNVTTGGARDDYITETHS